MADITRVVSTGPSAQRVDVVFVAEGYQASERSKFLADVAIFSDYMFSVSSNMSRLNAPFSAFENYFNVSALFVASAQSGTDQPNKGIFVDTYFNSTQHGADGRLNYGDQNKLATVLSQSFAADAREIGVVLINSPVYGGAGGSSAWVTTGDIASAEVMLHEIGHSFAGLEDEYADPALVNTYPLNWLDSVHVTSSLSNIPWRAWMDYTDELGLVGTYEGGYYRSSGVWRATLDSKMLSLGKPFSAPQKEAFVLAFYKALGDYLDVRSDIPGLFAAAVPDADMLRFAWSVNGQSVTGDGVFFDAYGRGAYQNGRTIALTTTDDSGYLRTGLAQTQQTENRTLAGVAVTDVASSSYVVGQSGVLVRMNAQDNQITVQSGARSFYVDGGQGVDTLVLNAASGSFELSKLTTGTTMFLQQGRAVMAAANVEKVKFTDKTVWLGATPGTMVTGGASNDVFRATSASDGFDGGAGIDTVVFSGSRAAYSLSAIQAGEWVVTSASGGTDVLRNVERMRFDDAAVALDIQGHGGQAYRLYQAAFARQPDAKGLGDWIEFLDRGGSLEDAAKGFVVSPEFRSLYGADPGTKDLVTRFYQNVLHRDPEPAGFEYWFHQINAGVQTVPMVLAKFSESPENQANLMGVIGDGFSYIPFG